MVKDENYNKGVRSFLRGTHRKAVMEGNETNDFFTRLGGKNVHFLP